LALEGALAVDGVHVVAAVVAVEAVVHVVTVHGSLACAVTGACSSRIVVWQKAHVIGDEAIVHHVVAFELETHPVVGDLRLREVASGTGAAPGVTS